MERRLQKKRKKKKKKNPGATYFMPPPPPPKKKKIVAWPKNDQKWVFIKYVPVLCCQKTFGDEISIS